VRDKDTLVGKGFGFVLLVNKASVGAALHLHQKPFKGRPLRVTVSKRLGCDGLDIINFIPISMQVCGKRTKGRRGSAKPAQDEQNISSFEGRRAEGATRRLAGKGRLPEKKKKRKRPK
jgi:RNA recognition motif-containing protein